MDKQFFDAIRVVDADRLDYLVRYSANEAEGAIVLLNPYEFDIFELVHNINGYMPKHNMGPDNPNTGQPHHWIHIGRENSRVIYLTFYKFNMPKDYDYAAMGRNLKAFGRKAGADEFSVEWAGQKCSVRYWWD